MTRMSWLRKLIPFISQTTSYNFIKKLRNSRSLCWSNQVPVNTFQECCSALQWYQHAVKARNTKKSFYNAETGKPKLLHCIRVDGARDEVPGHEDAQYYCTLWKRSWSHWWPHEAASPPTWTVLSCKMGVWLGYIVPCSFPPPFDLVILSQVKLTMKFFVRIWILPLIFKLIGVMDVHVGKLKLTCLRVVPLINRRERN